MTTLADWIEETRSNIDGEGREELNILDVDYTAGSGTISLRQPMGGIGAGAVLSIGTNTLRVIGTNPVGKQATVVGGWNGSTDANATAGAVIRVNPRFTDNRIKLALNAHLNSLSSARNGLYAVTPVEFTYSAAEEGYDLGGSLTTSLVRVLEVRYQTPGPTLNWPRVEAWKWDLIRNANTTDFPSGIGLRVRDAESGFKVRVLCATGFTALSNLSDNVTTTGLGAEASDIPPLGAAIRLIAGREFARNNLHAQGDSRAAAEVPPGAIAGSVRPLAAEWARRVGEEAARLRAKYPIGM